MNCRDFERVWNERMDAREAASPDQERALEVHATACPACRALGLRYQTLRQAIRSLGPAPAPPSGFAARASYAYEDAHARAYRRQRLRRILVPVALAATVLVGLFLPPHKEDNAPPDAVVTDTPSAPLTDALADATSATWDLAREASAPAARLSREAISSAVESETASAIGADEEPATVAIGAATGLLHSVGARVNEGVRPLSGTARHAFGFLFDSAPDDAQKPPVPAHGA